MFKKKRFPINSILVSRFRCPKGWKRLGGSCYYFSNQTSTSFFVNYTCNYLHSNLSNLMQIRNAVELFYAAHVLSRNNLSSLMIDIDPNLLKGSVFFLEMIIEKEWKMYFREKICRYINQRSRIMETNESKFSRITDEISKIKAQNCRSIKFNGFENLTTIKKNKRNSNRRRAHLSSSSYVF